MSISRWSIGGSENVQSQRQGQAHTHTYTEEEKAPFILPSASLASSSSTTTTNTSMSVSMSASVNTPTPTPTTTSHPQQEPPPPPPLPTPTPTSTHTHTRIFPSSFTPRGGLAPVDLLDGHVDRLGVVDGVIRVPRVIDRYSSRRVLTTELAAGVRAGVGLISLGSHGFAGLPDPIEVFQVEAAGVPEVFPPLRTGK